MRCELLSNEGVVSQFQFQVRETKHQEGDPEIGQKSISNPKSRNFKLNPKCEGASVETTCTLREFNLRFLISDLRWAFVQFHDCFRSPDFQTETPQFPVPRKLLTVPELLLILSFDPAETLLKVIGQMAFD